MSHSPITRANDLGSEAATLKDRPSHVGAVPRSHDVCPICNLLHWTYLFGSHGTPVYRCKNCGLTRLHPQPTRAEILAFYAGSTKYNPFAADSRLEESHTERAAAGAYLQELEKRSTSRSRMLLVASRGHPFATIAASQGYEVGAFLDAEELSQATLPTDCFDNAVIIFQLEKATNPVTLLERIRAALKSDGTLLLVAPSMDSWPARFLRDQWTVWRPENLYYLDNQTIQSVLLRSGFERIRIAREYRRYSLQHLYDRACTYPRTALTRLIRTVCHGVPTHLRRRLRFKVPASGIVVTAQCAERRLRPRLTIIMPAYNERPTVATTLNAVIAKDISGVDKEVIVVESNSTDGTREAVLMYQNHPDVKLVLEDHPKGKGSAVRAGLEHAKGDYILIQDADQEYDVNDYDALIEPLRNYSRAFVLGSRHIAGWKIRKFTDQAALAAFLNFGHLIFLSLLNLMYGHKLKDPFTMFKVFRRDCLNGLTFECNRFDFDFELVIKLLRKGYVPLEIPVNYQSRSLKQGKKVSMLRDPLTWIWALIKFRFTPLYSFRDPDS